MSTDARDDELTAFTVSLHPEHGQRIRAATSMEDVHACWDWYEEEIYTRAEALFPGRRYFRRAEWKAACDGKAVYNGCDFVHMREVYGQDVEHHWGVGYYQQKEGAAE